MSNTEPIYEYDTNGNEIHFRHSNGFEYWREYDTNGNCIHYRNSYGFESWYEYDTNGNCIHYRNSEGYESWHEYDTNGNEIHYRNSDGVEYWYDSDGNKIDKPTEKKDNDTMVLNAHQTIGLKWSELPSVDWEGHTPIVQYTHDRKNLIIIGTVSHEEEDDEMLSTHIPITVEEWEDNLGEHLIIKPVTLNGVMVHDAWISREHTLSQYEYEYIDFMTDIKKSEYNTDPVFVGESGLLYTLNDIVDHYERKINQLTMKIAKLEGNNNA